jgi:3-oxoadipate enol-lactonase
MQYQTASIYWEEQGAGEPLVLIHAHSVDSGMWAEQFGALAGHYRVIRYDLRGYGKSSMPERGEDFLHVEDLRRLMSKLGIGKAHLVGLSLGSMVALDMYGRYPERVLSVVCAASGLYAEEKIWHEDVNAANTTTADAMTGDAGALAEKAEPQDTNADEIDEDSFKQEWLELMLAHSGSGKSRIEKPLRDMIGRWSMWQPRYERRRPLVGPELVPLLREAPASIPLLVVTGGRDSEGSRYSSKKLLELLPQAQEAYLPNAGHFSNMEQPDAFNDMLIRFWKETGSHS